MSGKSCGLPGRKTENIQSMLGAGSLYNRNNSLEGKTNQIVSAIKKNRNDMVKLQTKTEHLEQSFLMERSLEKNASIDTSVLETKLEKKFNEKLDLMKGDFKQQMSLLKNYIHLLEKKISSLENIIIERNINIEKKVSIETTKKTENTEKLNQTPVNTDKDSDKKRENVTLEIKEK